MTGRPSSSASAKTSLVERRLALRLVRLHLEVVAVLEQLGVPGRRLARRVESIVHQVLRDFAGQAGRRDDEPLVVLREQLAVDARLGVEAFGVGERRELDQVPVAGHVAREQHEMVVRLGAWRRPRFVRAGPRARRTPPCR